MLKITTKENPEAIEMKLEGRVAGPWVNELSRAWREVSHSLGSRALIVDLSDVTFITSEGKSLLRGIYEVNRAKFLANTPLTKSIADELMHGLTPSTTNADRIDGGP